MIFLNFYLQTVEVVIYRLVLEHMMIHITGIKFQIQIIQTGCHTYEINQNENDGWIRVSLKEGTEYTIGMNGSPNGFDEYIWLYDSTREYVLAEADGNGQDIDSMWAAAVLNWTAQYTGEYYIKIGSWQNENPDNTATVHCYPAPVNSGSGGGESYPELIEIDDNCYVMFIQIENPGGYIEIYDDWYNEGGNDPAIDWGDNNLESDFSDNVFTHYYQSSGTYKIIWRNGATDWANYVKTGDYCKIKNVSQLSYNRYNYTALFEQCSFSDNAEVNFRNCPEYITSFNYMFSQVWCDGNGRLKLTGYSCATDFSYMFYNASISILEMKYTLYQSAYHYAENEYPTFYCMFNGSLVLAIYNKIDNGFETPFNLPIAGDLSFMFENCFNLDLVPYGDWELSWVRNWKMNLNSQYGWTRNVYNMFYQCYSIQGTVPAQVFWEHPEAESTYTSHERCFYGCYELNNFNEIPSDWKN